ncbi:MAG: Na+/H+ antiporter subunit E [Desulfobacterales bacterium]|nr:Na+/H+ antiporter subunit E [Desulfobacterales bacterium]
MKKALPSSRADKPTDSNLSQTKRFRQFNFGTLLSFFILFGLWVVLSGRFDGFHLVLGVISSAIVALISGDLIFTSPKIRSILMLWLRWVGYVPWLVFQVFLANLQVMYLTFHPRMLDLIDPHIIEFDSRLKSDYARTTFANSITLTPGTITVNATVLGRFAVHCINTKSGQALPGKMEAKVAKVFNE